MINKLTFLRDFSGLLMPFVFLLLAIYSHDVLASEQLVIEQHFYEDKTATSSLDEIKAQRLNVFDGVLNKGYSDSAFWVRLTLDKTKLQNQQKIAIKILPAYLDEISLFTESDGRYQSVVGDRHPQKNNAVSALNYNFVTTFNAGHPYIWLRLKTSSTSLMSVEVMTLNEFAKSNFTEQLLGGLMIGTFCYFVLMAVTYFFHSPELVNGTFLVKQLCNLLLAFMFFGYGHVFLSDIINSTVIDYLTSFSFLIYSVATSVFYWMFYRDYRLRKWVNVFFILFTLLLALEIIVFNLGFNRIVMASNMKLNAIACIVNFLLIPLLGIDWQKQTKPVINKQKLLLVQGLSLIAFVFSFLPHFVSSEATKISPYVFMLNACFSSLLMMLLIRHRAIKLDQERLLQIAIKDTKYEQEKVRREKQEKFMAMLTHELKTPLSLIRFAVSTALGKSKVSNQVNQAVEDINSVIERCQQADKLDKGLQLNKEMKNLRLIINECLERLNCKDRVSVLALPDIEVFIDVKLFNVIINNLLENALKYSPKDELVYLEITTSQMQPNFILTLKNKVGRAGIPDKNRIFEKYYRSEYAHEVTGSGLGLYIVKSLLELLGGTIEYIYEEGFVVFKLCQPK